MEQRELFYYTRKGTMKKELEEFKIWYPKLVAAVFNHGTRLPAPSVARRLHRMGFEPDEIAARLRDQQVQRTIRRAGSSRGRRSFSVGGSYDGKPFRLSVPKRLTSAIAGPRRRRRGYSARRSYGARRGYGSRRSYARRGRRY